MKRLAKSRTDWHDLPNPAIWQGIVEYANADLQSDQRAARRLKTLVGRCINRLETVIAYNFSDIVEVRSSPAKYRMTQEESFAYWGKHYQPAFRRLLTWLCAPDKHQEIAAEAAHFLQEMNQGVEITVEEPNVDFDLDHRPIFVFPSVRFCASIMSPIGKFLVDQIWKFQEHDLPLRKVIPVRLCDRAGCGRFKLPEKWRELCFCSDRCRSAYHQSRKSREDKNKYMRDWRRTQSARSATKKRGKLGGF